MYVCKEASGQWALPLQLLSLARDGLWGGGRKRTAGCEPPEPLLCDTQGAQVVWTFHLPVTSSLGYYYMGRTCSMT